MFSISSEQYTLNIALGKLPLLYDLYTERASYVDEYDLDNTYGDICFVSVERSRNKPFLVVTQSYSPAPSAGFNPGALIATDTNTLFIGAGKRLLAYDLTTPNPLWQDSTYIGFWDWAEYNNTVIMAAEDELAAWSNTGEKLWTLFVEPPWDYSVKNNTLYLEVMGTKSSFNIRSGPNALTHWELSGTSPYSSNKS